MKMTRNKVSALIIFIIVLIVFNAIAFSVPFIRETGFWIGYSANTVAIFLGAGVALYAMGREGLKSKFYGVPLVYLAWIYLVVQMILGFIYMIIPVTPIWLEVVLSVVVLGVVLIGLVAAEAGKTAIEKIDQKVAEKVFYIKSMQVDVEMLSEQTTDPALKKALKDFAEAIRYSDPMSHEKLAAVENNLEVKAAQLAQAITSNDSAAGMKLVEEAQLLLAERNKKCKLLKGM